MSALRYHGHGRASLERLPVPALRPGTVRLAISAAGICHTDINVLDGRVGGEWQRPFTLGHEIAGVVTEVAADVDPVWLGMLCAVYAPTGCGTCANCRRESPNYCLQRIPSAAGGLGLGDDGGLADQIVVEPGRLLPVDGVAPEVAAVLTDAGLTAYHATSLVRADAPDTTVVVLGVGGLGHLAVQFLRHAAASTIVAVDVRPDVESLARRCGADAFCTPDQLRELLPALPGGGAAAVLDFVGSDATLALAVSVLAPDADLVCVGSGGGRLVLGKGEGSLPRGVHVHFPAWGSKAELQTVLALAEQGVITPAVSAVTLSDVVDAVDRLRDGRVVGRMVAVPGARQGARPPAA